MISPGTGPPYAGSGVTSPINSRGMPDPPSSAADDVDISFGSCRLGHPHDEPYCLTKDLDAEGRGVDALYALALRMLTDARCRLAGVDLDARRPGIRR